MSPKKAIALFGAILFGTCGNAARSSAADTPPPSNSPSPTAEAKRWTEVELNRMLVGKSKAQVKSILGVPDDASTPDAYFGAASWRYANVRIYNPDSEKETKGITILFSGDSARLISVWKTDLRQNDRRQDDRRQNDKKQNDRRS